MLVAAAPQHAGVRYPGDAPHDWSAVRGMDAVLWWIKWLHGCAAVHMHVDMLTAGENGTLIFW